MKIAGIVAEYNPFHKGHQYHIEKTKEITGATHVVVCMSGDYVQRGEPAIMDKFVRTRLALEQGADIVVELPVQLSTASAENFAHGSISLFERLNVIDCISFGCEDDNIELLKLVGNILANEPEEFKSELNCWLKQGYSFPRARQEAVKKVLASAFSAAPSFSTAPAFSAAPSFSIEKKEERPSEEVIDSILSSPNNTLALEYLKALNRLGSQMEAFAVKRIGKGYNDGIDGGLQAAEAIASAKGIREILEADRGIEEILTLISDFVSEDEMKKILELYGRKMPVKLNDFSGLLKYRLLNEINSQNSLQKFLDVSEELEKRIIKNARDFENIEELLMKLKTKQYTYTRISRCLMHILLGIEGPGIQESPYCRILGFRKSASELVKMINEKASLPIITKPSSYKEILADSEQAKRVFEQNINASEIYHSIISEKYGFTAYNELKQNMIIL